MGGVVNILEELMGDRFRSRYRDEPYCQAAYGEKGMRDKKHSGMLLFWNNILLQYPSDGVLLFNEINTELVVYTLLLCVFFLFPLSSLVTPLSSHLSKFFFFVVSPFITVAPSIKLDEKVSSSKENVEDRQSAALPQPYLDLFTWAVLCNRKDLALLLWKRSRNPIACAVMASKLLKTLANKIIDNKELADSVDDLLEHAR